jgi:GH15 family glucan-1,4-alpha-glucosidase
MLKRSMGVFAFAAACVLAGWGSAMGQPTLVEHNPGGSLPGGGLNPPNPFAGATTQKSPLVSREDEAVRVFVRVGCQFNYDRVAIYYTTDGSTPQGSFGTPLNGSTQVLLSTAGQVTFVANDFNNVGQNCVQDWWVATLPVSTREYNNNVRYRVAAWKHLSGPEVQNFQTFQYTNKLAWPGQGSAFPGNEGIGYPPFHSWKEEGVIGNNWINAMLDQNASYFDVYFPGAGGVQGVGTKNEGYVNGLDTFPAGLSLDRRGQMHLNQAFVGLRADDVTSWLTNRNGTDFVNLQQAYEERTNTIRTSARFVRNGNDIDVVQYDFSPKGVTYAGNDNRMVLLKRLLLTNRSASTKTVNVYMFMDPAINGSDNYDAMFVDNPRNAMVAYDNTYRVVSGTGCCFAPSNEYNPTTFGGYEKNVSLYLAASMKTLSSPGSAGGTIARDSWRDTSGDNGQGWIGQQVVLPPNVEVEVNFTMVGGFDNFAGAVGTYNAQIAPVIDWFNAGNVAQWQNQTDGFWQAFLDQGVNVDLPDAAVERTFERGLLATMLHFDERRGGLIAGFRNGAYPYVWPRDMAWAGVTLARAGHTETVEAMTRFLRDITFRDFETWTPANTPPVEAAGGAPFYGTRKGFWKQKYSTDGFTIWGAPQVDETAVIPWMIHYNYLVTGDVSYLTEAESGNPANTNYAIVKDAAIAMSQTSKIDPTRMNHRPSYPGSGSLMMYSNNIWEDSYDTFIFSNANIVRGLRDAAAIATVLGQNADAADFTNRANGILAGLTDKLNWNGEKSDISMLGIVYPFEVFSPTSPQAVKVIDRINGVAADRFGNVHPLVRFAGQYNNDASDYVGLIDRYWGDSYWANGALGPTPAGPWFLTTMWYGVYYALRQDYTPGTGDIDNHLYRLKRTMDHNGPLGLGAEQMAPINSLQYPGQTDFTLQTAWPNAWESMSFYVDAVMMFLDYKPDAPGNTLRIEPKLPSVWPSMTYRNLEVGDHRVSVEITHEDYYYNRHIFTNQTGNEVDFDTVLRIQPGVTPCAVLVNGVAVTPEFVDTATGRVGVKGALATGAGATTIVEVSKVSPVDYNRDGFTNLDDLGDYITDYYTVPAIPGGNQPDAPNYPGQFVGFSAECVNAGDAPAPYAPNAYRTLGYRVGFSIDGSNTCPLDPFQSFPNLDNLNDFITAFYSLQSCTQ